MRLITCNKNYRFLRFLAVFLTSGVLKWQISKNYEPGKNIKTYDITDIVPAPLIISPIKNAPKKGESVGRFDGKNFMKHKY